MKCAVKLGAGGPVKKMRKGGCVTKAYGGPVKKMKNGGAVCKKCGGK